MKKIIPLIFSAALASCASNSPSLAQADINGDGVISPTEDARFKQQKSVTPKTSGTGQVRQGIRDTAATVGLVRNIQSIFGGF